MLDTYEKAMLRGFLRNVLFPDSVKHHPGTMPYPPRDHFRRGIYC